jgi:hypothetical protein
MNKIKNIIRPAFLLCMFCLFTLSCEKDLDIQENENLKTEIIQQDLSTNNFKEEKTCINKNTTKICACGKTLEDAKLQLAAKARLDCVGQCLGQNCNKNKNCSLKHVKQKTVATFKEKEDLENPLGPPLWEACATFRCQCGCVSCAGNKQVAKDETATAPDAASAFAMAAQKAKTWCATFGCPTFQSCKTSKNCVSTGGGKVRKISEEQVPGPVPFTFQWKVTVLLTECTCKCA